MPTPNHDKGNGYVTDPGKLMLRAAAASLRRERGIRPTEDNAVLIRMVEMFDTEYDSFVDTAHAFRNDDQLTTNSEGYYTLAHDTGKSPNSVDSPFDKEIRKAAQAHAYAVVAEMRAEEAKHIRAAQKLEKHKQYLDDLAEQRWHASLRKATNN